MRKAYNIQMIETVLMFFVLFGPDFTYKATE